LPVSENNRYILLKESIWVPDNQVNSSYSTDLGSLLTQNEKIVDSCSVSVKYIGYSPIPANIEIPVAELENKAEHREQTINTLTLNQEKIGNFYKTIPISYCT
jgi:hypothetical protein